MLRSPLRDHATSKRLRSSAETTRAQFALFFCTRVDVMITITDLPVSHALDCEAMRSLHGGGAPWVFGFSPYVRPVASAVPTVNLFEITNNYNYIGSQVNEFTVFNLENSGDNATLTTVFLGAQKG
jgi:hypothetical protein